MGEQTSVVEYVGKSLGGRGGELLKVLNLLMDRGAIDFNEGASAGYLDSLELADGKTLEDVDAVLAEYLEAQTEPTGSAKVQTLRGQYEKGLIVPRDAVTKRVFDGMPFNTETAIEVISKECAADRQAKDVIVTLRNNQTKINEVMGKLNADDRLVFAAICNCVANGIYSITPIQLFRRAYQDGQANPKTAQLARMHDSIVKMAGIVIELDVSAIFSIYPDLKAIKTVGNFIEVAKWAFRPYKGGEISEFYEFGRNAPILYQYAIAINQMTTIKPTSANALSTNLRRTKDNQAIVQLIADRVDGLEGMKKGGKKPYRNMYKINYQSFYNRVDFSKCSTDDSRKKKRQRIKNAVRKQLDYLTERGVIASWERLEDGSGVTVNPGGAA